MKHQTYRHRSLSWATFLRRKAEIMGLTSTGRQNSYADAIDAHFKRPVSRSKITALGAAFCVAIAFAVDHAAAADQPLRCVETDSSGACSLYATSVIQLVANPAAFHAKRIRVIGYLNIEFEGTALYLHAEDHQRGLTDNGLWLEVPVGWPAKNTGCVSRSYALLEGTFDANINGHGGLFSGSLEQVTRCTPWRSNATMPRKK